MFWFCFVLLFPACNHSHHPSWAVWPRPPLSRARVPKITAGPKIFVSWDEKSDSSGFIALLLLFCFGFFQGYFRRKRKFAVVRENNVKSSKRSNNIVVTQTAADLQPRESRKRPPIIGAAVLCGRRPTVFTAAETPFPFFLLFFLFLLLLLFLPHLHLLFFPFLLFLHLLHLFLFPLPLLHLLFFLFLLFFLLFLQKHAQKDRRGGKKKSLSAWRRRKRK